MPEPTEGETQEKGEKAASLEQMQREIMEAWDEQHPRRTVADPNISSWVVETFEDRVIAWLDGEHWSVPFERAGDEIVFADKTEWQEVEEKREWTAKTGNALKTVSKTDSELRVANYIVLFGGRDLEGTVNDNKNVDGTSGEFFTKATKLDSPYTATGHLLVDWEHGQGKHLDGNDSPGDDDIFGFVDWKSAEIDDVGVWVERVLSRRSKYMRHLETLIDAGAIGNSSEAITKDVAKKDGGEIAIWPLRRDTFTVTPMEPRMMSENVIQAMKALGLKTESPANEPKPEAQPEASKSLAVEAAKARLAVETILYEIAQEKNT